MGIIFGLFAGFFDAVKNVLAKKDTKEYSETTINFAWMFFATVVTLPLALLNIPKAFSPQLQLVFLVVTLLDFFAYMFYLKSIKLTDLSLSLPMLALTPVFVLIISFLLLGQKISWLAVCGVCFIILGGYLLNIKKGKLGLLDPIKNMANDKGICYMLLTSVLWGFANSLHKIGITESSPLFYTGVSYALLSILYLLLLLWQNKSELSIFMKWGNIKVLAQVGFFEGITAIFQFLSQNLITSSVITISLKRSSIVFSALFGYLFFQEKVKDRIVPIGLVIVGIVLVSL